MAGNGKRDACRLGFLTAVDVPDCGFIGGLLVTNHRGRPLEFQCTTPVKPNATQQILYGPTLREFLFGELIGRTLVEKIGVKPGVVLTEQTEVLPLREHVDVPVVLLAENDADQTAPRLGRQRLRFHQAHTEDAVPVKKFAEVIPDDADLREPFQRVRDALQEALKTGTGR